MGRSTKGSTVRPGSRIAFDYKPKPPNRVSLPHLHRFIAGLLLSVVCGGAVYVLSRPGSWFGQTAVVIPALTTADLPPLDPGRLVVLPKLPAPGSTLGITVRPSDTLERLFRRYNLSAADLAAIRSLEGVRHRLDQLRQGERIVVVQEQGAVRRLERRVSETEILSVKRGESGFEANIIATPIETRISRAHGEIDSSLFNAALAAGLTADTVLQLANGIFGWKIDFALEIQPGDSFTLVYERRFRDGSYLDDGRILAAEFVNAGTVYRAMHYTSKDGKITGYFDLEGRSMRRQFLRAPLDFTRISSNFNLKRRHPILNLIRAHRGVDYAAPTGTAIKAAGEGRVSFAGVKGGYGNVIILEHGAGISTLYAHMSRFTKQMRAGRHVQQGQVIGYVGSSGAATGPHLHYEYRVNGQHKNPRTVPLPDAKPIPSAYSEEFAARRAALLTELDRARESAVLAVPADG
jgi:murein DD-endopeptidase MepM/ murein hydrolase activator NlpD